MSAVQVCLVRSAVVVLAVAAGWPATASATTPPQQVDISARVASGIPASEFAAVRGEYMLEDGNRLTIEGPRQRPTVSLGEGGPIALLASGPHQYVSADGSIQLRFQPHPNGVVEQVRVTLRRP